MLNYTIFIIVALGGTFISASIFISLLDYDAKAASFWLIIVVCTLIGCVLGWIAVKIEILGFVCLGAFLGFIGGSLLFTAILAPAGAKLAVYWVIVIVAALIGSFVAYKYWK